MDFPDGVSGTEIKQERVERLWKCVVVEYRLRWSYWWEGFGVWLHTWPPCVETLGRCSQVGVRPTAHKFEAETLALSLSVTFPFACKHSHAWISLWHAHTSYIYSSQLVSGLSVCARSLLPECSRVSPLCVPSVIGDLRVFRGWVGGSDLT